MNWDHIHGTSGSGYFRSPGYPLFRQLYNSDYVRKNLEGEILYTNIDSLTGNWNRYNDNKDYYSYYLLFLTDSFWL